MASLALDSLLAPGLPGLALARLREALTDLAPAHLSAVVEEAPPLLLALLRRGASLAPTPEQLPRDAQEACHLMGQAQAVQHVRMLAMLLLPAQGREAAWEHAARLRETGDRLLAHMQDAALGALPVPGAVERTLLRLLELPASHGIQEAPALWGRWLLAISGGVRWWHADLAQALLGMEDPAAVPGQAGRRAALLVAVAEGSQPGKGLDADVLRRWERQWSTQGVLRHG